MMAPILIFLKTLSGLVNDDELADVAVLRGVEKSCWSFASDNTAVGALNVALLVELLSLAPFFGQ